MFIMLVLHETFQVSSIIIKVLERGSNFKETQPATSSKGITTFN